MADIRLWLDDERPMPEDYTHHVKTSAEAILFLRSLNPQDNFQVMSFDHDLGLPWEDGHPSLDNNVRSDDARPVVHWMVENGVFPSVIYIHSHNPIGAKWIEETFRRNAPFPKVLIYREPYKVRR